MRAVRTHPRSGEEAPLQVFVIFGAWWAAMFAAWFALVDTVATPEIVLGAVSSAVAASVAVAVHRRGYIRFQPRARWLKQTPTLAWSVVADCGVLGLALWRRVVRRETVEGRTVRIAFDHGGDNGRDGARRALVNLSVSLTPNSFVIDIDPEANSLLVHQLVARPLDAVLARQESRAHTRGIRVEP
jgi:multisubunit Na+/H+ antiporter MnhE subunit